MKARPHTELQRDRQNKRELRETLRAMGFRITTLALSEENVRFVDRIKVKEGMAKRDDAINALLKEAADRFEGTDQQGSLL